MSINKYSTEDISRFAEKIEKLERNLKNLKFESKIYFSDAISIIDTDISKDGDIIMTSLEVATGKKVIFQFAFDSLYQDFNSTIYSQGENSSYLSAESNYLVWLVLGINNGAFHTIELTFTAGSRRTYAIKSIFTAGDYSNLKLFCRVVEQNSTPQRRSAPYWGSWIAYEVNV